MKNLNIIFAFFILCIASITLHAAYLEGSVVFHTIRNNPEITRNNVSEELQIGTITTAKGLKIVCKKNQYVSLKFSNEVVIEILPESSLEIKEFKQVQPFKQKHYDERECAESELSLLLNGGKINLISKEQRAMSSLKISTTLGNFSLKGKAFIIEDKKTSAEISVVEGVATYNSKNNKSDYVRNKQKGIVKDSTINQNFPLIIDRIGILEEQELSKSLSACRQIQDSVLFEFDSSNKLIAKRIIFKEFILRPPKYNY